MGLLNYQTTCGYTTEYGNLNSHQHLLPHVHFAYVYFVECSQVLERRLRFLANCAHISEFTAPIFLLYFVMNCLCAMHQMKFDHQQVRLKHC